MLKHQLTTLLVDNCVLPLFKIVFSMIWPSNLVCLWIKNLELDQDTNMRLCKIQKQLTGIKDLIDQRRMGKFTIL